QGPMDSWSPAVNFSADSDYKWAHFSTGPPEEYAKVFDLLGGSKVTFDPGQEIHYRYSRETAQKFIDRADMFVGNEAEYQKLKELTGKSHEELTSEIETIIITGGQSGVSAFRDGDSNHFSILPAEKVYDTIGAGDSFRSGLYMGLWKGMSISDSIIMGIIVSSKAIETPMSEFRFGYGDIEKLFREKRKVIAGE
ncbi:MAG TPA: PfkB family carbohydrate kinase, partial [Thermoplasmataceae archaeon]|nr:PfkB family carbohydrate kinase [Thermoplasmataceae archaeon]